MQPLTLVVSINTHREGIAMAALIREHDDTAEILLHEAKKGNGWSITAYICIPRNEASELRRRIRDTGALCVMRPADQA